MIPARFDFEIQRGYSYARDFAIYADTKLTEPKDYTGYTIEWILGTSMTLKAPIVGGTGLLLVENHVISAEIAPAATLGPVSFHKDNHKLQLVSPSGEKDCLINGVVVWKTP